MTTTLNDIIAERNLAVDILDQQIYAALAQKNARVPVKLEREFNHSIYLLMASRNKVFETPANDAMSSDEMTSTYHALRAATADMKAITARMQSVSGFVRSVAHFARAADTVVAAMQGGSGLPGDPTTPP
jgi:hypothetical protein